jgi:hypothetical protein
MVFCVMSGKRRRAYYKAAPCYAKLCSNLQRRLKLLHGFMIDFEAAMWQALTKVCPDANKKGCVFHLTKAVWVKVQNVGLATAYNERKSVDSFVRLTALLHSIVSSTLDANYSL